MRSMLQKNLEAFFLDFDGVVVESADIKTEAFYALYQSFGEDIASKAKNHHLLNQGVSRAQKFRYIHEKFLQKPLSSDEENLLSKGFSDIVLEKILKAPLVSGTLEFLKDMAEKHIPVFLLSATPHDELIYICRERGILNYFKGVYGTPYTKEEKGCEIIKENYFSPENIIFVGDSMSDFKAAKSLGIPFIGRLSADQNPFPKGVQTIDDFLAAPK